MAEEKLFILWREEKIKMAAWFKTFSLSKFLPCHEMSRFLSFLLFHLPSLHFLLFFFVIKNSKIFVRINFLYFFSFFPLLNIFPILNWYFPTLFITFKNDFSLLIIPIIPIFFRNLRLCVYMLFLWFIFFFFFSSLSCFILNIFHYFFLV